MSKIKTFEDACKALGLDSKKVIPDYSTYPEKHRKSMEAHDKLVIIVEALNEGWHPDWSNLDQDKYSLWFNMTKILGFSLNECAELSDFSPTSSRLCFKSRELAEYAGKQFIEIYKEFLNR